MLTMSHYSVAMAEFSINLKNSTHQFGVAHSRPTPRPWPLTTRPAPRVEGVAHSCLNSPIWKTYFDFVISLNLQPPVNSCSNAPPPPTHTNSLTMGTDQI